MNYRRNIVDSEEYKQLINYIDKDVIKIKDIIRKLRDEDNNVLAKMFEYSEEMDSLSEKLKVLNNEIDYRCAKYEKSEKISFMALIGILGICALNAVGVSEDVPLLSNVIQITGSSCIGIASGFGIFHELKNNRPYISNYELHKEMRKIGTKKLMKDAGKIRSDLNKMVCNYSSKIRERIELGDEICSKKSELDSLINKKNNIALLANNYDSINELQRMAGISMYEERQKEKQTVKVLKRKNNK